MDVRHRHIQKVHLFSSKNIIQFSWFSPLQTPSLPPKQVSSISGAQTRFVCCLGQSACALACLLVFNLLSDFLGFRRLCWCAEVLGPTKNQSTLLKLLCTRNVFNVPPKKNTKQKQKNKTKKKHRRGREGEENLRRRRRKASWARNF